MTEFSLNDKKSIAKEMAKLGYIGESRNFNEVIDKARVVVNNEQDFVKENANRAVGDLEKENVYQEAFAKSREDSAKDYAKRMYIQNTVGINIKHLTNNQVEDIYNQTKAREDLKKKREEIHDKEFEDKKNFLKKFGLSEEDVNNMSAEDVFKHTQNNEKLYNKYRQNNSLFEKSESEDTAKSESASTLGSRMKEKLNNLKSRFGKKETNTNEQNENPKTFWESTKNWFKNKRDALNNISLSTKINNSSLGKWTEGHNAEIIKWSGNSIFYGILASQVFITGGVSLSMAAGKIVTKEALSPIIDKIMKTVGVENPWIRNALKVGIPSALGLGSLGSYVGSQVENMTDYIDNNTSTFGNLKNIAGSVVSNSENITGIGSLLEKQPDNTNLENALVTDKVSNVPPGIYDYGQFNTPSVSVDSLLTTSGIQNTLSDFNGSENFLKSLPDSMSTDYLGNLQQNIHDIVRGDSLGQIVKDSNIDWTKGAYNENGLGVLTSKEDLFDINGNMSTDYKNAIAYAWNNEMGNTINDPDLIYTGDKFLLPPEGWVPKDDIYIKEYFDKADYLNKSESTYSNDASFVVPSPAGNSDVVVKHLMPENSIHNISTDRIPQQPPTEPENDGSWINDITIFPKANADESFIIKDDGQIEVTETKQEYVLKDLETKEKVEINKDKIENIDPNKLNIQNIQQAKVLEQAVENPRGAEVTAENKQDVTHVLNQVEAEREIPKDYAPEVVGERVTMDDSKEYRTDIEIKKDVQIVDDATTAKVETGIVETQGYEGVRDAATVQQVDKIEKITEIENSSSKLVNEDIKIDSPGQVSEAQDSIETKVDERIFDTLLDQNGMGEAITPKTVEENAPAVNTTNS